MVKSVKFMLNFKAFYPWWYLWSDLMGGGGWSMAMDNIKCAEN